MKVPMLHDTWRLTTTRDGVLLGLASCLQNKLLVGGLGETSDVGTLRGAQRDFVEEGESTSEGVREK